jgi:hypothetical protein
MFLLEMEIPAGGRRVELEHGSWSGIETPGLSARSDRGAESEPGTGGAFPICRPADDGNIPDCFDLLELVLSCSS